MIRTIVWSLLPLAALACPALAQGPAGSGASSLGSSSLWDLFRQSFDLFTILLLLGSLTGLAVVFLCVIEIRESRILPPESVRRTRDLASSRRWDDLRDFVRDDESFVGRVLRASIVRHKGGDKTVLREAAELAASEESARWFRKIELLNVIGNLGPLVGLAGTVWGMILAFTSLGSTGGQAGPADLSLGISKALFHTLLGLCLAIPCLLVFGIYRSVVDRICTRAMIVSSEIIEKFPSPEQEAAEHQPKPSGPVAASPASPSLAASGLAGTR